MGRKVTTRRWNFEARNRRIASAREIRPTGGGISVKYDLQVVGNG